MSLKQLRFFNWFLVFVLLIVSCSVQTILIDFKYQYFSAPLLWIQFPLYVLIYRNYYVAIPAVYLMCVFISTSSSMPLPMLWIVFSLLSTLIVFIRGRIFWEGPIYFAIMSWVGAAAFHIIHYATSQFLEKSPASLELLPRLTQIILTPIFAFPVFALMTWLDHRTFNAPRQESGEADL